MQSQYRHFSWYMLLNFHGEAIQRQGYWYELRVELPKCFPACHTADESHTVNNDHTFRVQR